jgi:hypothetical protein
MPDVWRSHDDGSEVLRCEHGNRIRVATLDPEALLDARESRGLGVDRHDAAHIGMGEERGDVNLACPPPRADYAHVHLSHEALRVITVSGFDTLPDQKAFQIGLT